MVEGEEQRQQTSGGREQVVKGHQWIENSGSGSRAVAGEEQQKNSSGRERPYQNKCGIHAI